MAQLGPEGLRVSRCERVVHAIVKNAIVPAHEPALVKSTRVHEHHGRFWTDRSNPVFLVYDPAHLFVIRPIIVRRSFFAKRCFRRVPDPSSCMGSGSIAERSDRKSVV